MANFYELKDNFIDELNRSEDKDERIRIEIEAHERLFDNNRFPLIENIHTGRRIEGLLIYTDRDIIAIREAYRKHIVYGRDIESSGDLTRDKNGWYETQPPSDMQLYYLGQAEARYQYLQWLKSGPLKKARRGTITTLEEACKSEKIDKLKTWFMDNMLVDPLTFIWRDTRKSILVNYLKELHVKGYTTRSITQDEIKAIARNSFGTVISKDTIKRPKGNDPKAPALPPA